MRGLLRGIEEQRENGLGEEEGAPSMSHQRHLISQGPARGKRAVSNRRQSLEVREG